jgi:glycosyltransferase involved in cell wall biosynthesis
MPQGIRAFMPDLATPVKVLHHGFDPEKWPLGDKVERQGIVTVALQAGSERVKQLKGVDVLIEVARIHPEVPVTIVGLDETHAGTLPKNVTAITRCTPAELARIHQRSRFYLQLSMSEGFGCALAEAMLCGCIPIVSTAGSLPGIVADTGYLVNSRTPDALARSMQLANSEYGADRPLRARDRIVRGFPLKAREQGWHELVNGLLANS